jgi:hypothetical protein
MVVNTDLGPLATQLGGVTTFVLAGTAVWLVGLAVARDAASVMADRHVQPASPQPGI